MNADKILKGNRQFYFSCFCVMVEGLLSGCNFMLIYFIFQNLWRSTLEIHSILKLTGGLAVIFLLRIFIYSFGYVQGQLGGAGISKRIRLYIGDKMKRIPLARFTSLQTGEYINAATADVNSFQSILTHKYGDLIKNITLSLMLIGFVCTLSLAASLILMSEYLFLVLALWISINQVRKYGNEKNDICVENVSGIVEYITGIQTFRAYGIGGTKNKTVTAAMKAFSDISFVYEAKIIPVGVIYSVFIWLTMPVIMYVVGESYINGEVDAITFIMVCLFPLLLSKLMGTIFVDFTSYKNLMISKRKIENVIYEAEETHGSSNFIPKKHDVSLEHIDFSYIQGEAILKDISLSIPHQKMTAIVGDSGSGKSTILNLIAKFYEPQSGEIKIGGISTLTADAVQVLGQISMVDQDIFLFNDTVKNNIRFARPSATDEEIEQACKEANCDSFIRKMPKGYDTMVGENGNQLSGGERQRLSIARAILKNAPILLLDEATASLDVENELAVKNAISNLLKSKKTVVMIAHTLSIVQHADQIVVVSGGSIAEKGKHEELLQKNGKYASMWLAEQKLYK